jgi:glycosyltransferase involved in cell wall biosynthesis
VRVLISSGIWPPEVGGPASHGPEFGRFLAERGHRVRAVTTAGPAGPEPAGFPIRAARKDRHQLIRQPAAAVTVLAAARGVDVVYATGLYGRSALAAAVHRVPLVLKLVNDPAYERARRLGVFTGTIEEFQAPQAGRRLALLKAGRRRVVERAELIIIPSRYLAAIAYGWGVAPERVRVVPNPAPSIDGATSRAELRHRLGFESPTFVFAGRLTPQKNLPLAISALSRVPGASLVVVGEGPSRAQVERVIDDAGLRDRVTLTGALPRSDAIEYMRAADASILPSDWENFPHAAVEALAAETPVIATAVGGVPEIVESGVNGLLVPRRDSEALAAAMTRLSEDDAFLAGLRAGALEAGERYRNDVVYGTIEAELGRVAASKNGAPAPVVQA